MEFKKRLLLTINYINNKELKFILHLPIYLELNNWSLEVSEISRCIDMPRDYVYTTKENNKIFIINDSVVDLSNESTKYIITEFNKNNVSTKLVKYKLSKYIPRINNLPLVSYD